MMCPQKATTIGAMAVAYASAGLVDQAALHFQEALCISPHDQVVLVDSLIVLFHSAPNIYL